MPTTSALKRRKGPSRRQPLRICVVTHELYGAAVVSEATCRLTGIAQNLAAAGDSVTLLWIPPNGMIEEEKAERLKAYYFERYLIKLQIFLKCEHMLPIITGAGKQSAAIYYYLSDHEFDVVYFGVEGGLGYYTLLARELGLLSKDVQLYSVLQSPLVWKSSADRFFLRDLHDVTVAHMERYCVEGAQHLISTSSAVVEWLASNKTWKIPADVKVLPGLVPHEWRGEGREPGARKIDELVFLGGADFHNGLTFFCDALDILAKDASLPRLTVTTLGDFGQILGEHTGGFVLRRGRNWPFELRMLPRMNEQECLQYLQGRGRLAIVSPLASMAPFWMEVCLDGAIPFVGTDVDATPELVAVSDRKRVLAPARPVALAERIATAIQRPQGPVKPMMPIQAKRAMWTDHSNSLALNLGALGAPRHTTRKKAFPKNTPFVSIVMVHHDRPQYLRQAVQAVEQQDYPRFELILVDDGSSLPESKALLDELEPVFKQKKWKILREENRYLGAARNTGVRASKGERILFVDDDNALFGHAVSTFVRAMDTSGADICTAFQKVFHGPSIPPDESLGFVHYFPPGGSVDLGLILDSFGDANAMIRREVFDKIGFQIEDYGYTAQDWEFFLRTVLAGLKLRVIPQPLYWYRSSAQGMYRSSHWYSNRLPILAVFRKHGFAGLDHVYDLVLSKFVGDFEIYGYRDNLNYSISDESHLRLSRLDPNSDAALDLLAEIAGREGRADTALVLLGRGQPGEFRSRALEKLTHSIPGDDALGVVSTGLFTVRNLDEHELRDFLVSALSADGPTPLSYVEATARLYLSSKAGDASIAVGPGICPAGLTGASAMISLDQEVTAPAEFLLTIAPLHIDARLAVRQPRSAAGNSGWVRLSNAWSKRLIEVQLATPLSQPHNLILAVRPQKASRKGVTGCFSEMKLNIALGAAEARHPRRGAPPNRLRARALTHDELKSVTLVTKLPSMLPLLMLDPKGDGIFLRPSQDGNVVATLPWGFPPFARQVLADVEIAHEEASPFEFAMALTRPAEPVNWTGETPEECQAFSGWKRVDEKFQLRELSMEIREPVRTHLAINLAIRLPKGSKPNPANTFWRRLTLVWDD